MHSSSFTEIVILESLSKDDWHTGKALYEHVSGINNLHALDLPIIYEACGDKTEFFSGLKKLSERAKSASAIPLLHIECHGSKSGITLSDGGLVTWEELKPYLTEINIQTKCNLMIVMATCHGAALGEIIQLVDRAPCWGMIGPAERVKPSELMSCYRAFYTKLLLESDGDAAVNAVFSADNRTADYYFMTALGLFKQVYLNYIKYECTPQAYWARAKRMFRDIRSSKTVSHFQNIQDVAIGLKKTERDSFEKYKSKFFMLDLFPENISRFPVEFDDMRKNQ